MMGRPGTLPPIEPPGVGRLRVDRRRVERLSEASVSEACLTPKQLPQEAAPR
jgi:hypothetical protein